MSQHLRKSPSSASRRYACPGSTLLGEIHASKDKSSSYADEGTYAHEYLIYCLITGEEPIDVDDAEMGNAIQAAIDYVNMIRGTLEIVEERFEEFVVSPNDPHRGGTPDIVIIGHMNDCLCGIVIDYKHGAGVEVPRRDNDQLMAYVTLLAETIPDVERWSYAVVQPRIGPPPQLVEVDEDDMRRVQELEDSMDSRTGEFHAGEHCRWCPAVPYCDTLYQLTIDVARESFDDNNYPRRWRKLLASKDAIDILYKSIAGAMVDYIKSGQSIRGWKLVDDYGNRVWKQPGTVETFLKTEYGFKHYEIETTPQLLSPAKIEKKLKTKNIDPEILEPLYEKPHKGLKLVKSTANGRPVTFENIKDQFDG